MAVRGKKERYWELREGGPYDGPGESREIFKCVDCGAETAPAGGWNGAPNPHKCHPGCRDNHEKIVGASLLFKRNFDRIFPNAPGTGI